MYLKVVMISGGHKECTNSMSCQQEQSHVYLKVVMISGRHKECTNSMGCQQEQSCGKVLKSRNADAILASMVSVN